MPLGGDNICGASRRPRTQAQLGPRRCDRGGAGRIALPNQGRRPKVEPGTWRYADKALRRVAVGHIRRDLVGIVALGAKHRDRVLRSCPRAPARLEPVVDRTIAIADRAHDFSAKVCGKDAIDLRARLSGRRRGHARWRSCGQEKQDSVVWASQARESSRHPLDPCSCAPRLCHVRPLGA